MLDLERQKEHRRFDVSIVTNVDRHVTMRLPCLLACLLRGVVYTFSKKQLYATISGILEGCDLRGLYLCQTSDL